MDDLVERLLAAIDAKAAGAEQAAASAKGGHWRARPARGPVGFVTLDDRNAVDVIAAQCSGVGARYIADNDPETVLRRCAADRVLLNIVQHALPEDGVALATLARIVIRQLADGYGITDTKEAG